jgi:hypothetical protein
LRLSEAETVLGYQQSDNAESFVWLVFWIAMSVSPLPSHKAYPSVNDASNLRLFKKDTLAGQHPTGSFAHPMQAMFTGLIKDAGSELQGLLLMHVSNRLVTLVGDIVEQRIFSG